MIEALQYPFMQRALLVGVLIGFLASYYGVFVVQRRLSFMGTGLAHAAFGGVALGLLLQIEPLWVAIPFTIVIAIAISWLKERTILAGDTAVGVLFAVAVALGILFLFLKQEYTAEAYAYLFGSILAVNTHDVWATAGVTLIAVATIPVFWSRWAYATFDRDLARADGVPVVRDDYVFSVLLAITIVIAMKVVGILLVAAFLIIPAATARLVVRTYGAMTVAAAAIGVTSAAIGLLLSYSFDIPSGATIILLQAVFFCGALVVSGVSPRAG